MILSGSSGSDAAPSVRRYSSDSSNLLLGNEPRLQKGGGGGEKKSKLQKAPRRCVYSDQLSVMTHSGEHERACENKPAEELDRETDVHIYTT